MLLSSLKNRYPSAESYQLARMPLKQSIIIRILNIVGLFINSNINKEDTGVSTKRGSVS